MLCTRGGSRNLEKVGTTHLFPPPPASKVAQVPKKLMSGGGGGGAPTHFFFFFRFQKGGGHGPDVPPSKSATVVYKLRGFYADRSKNNKLILK